MKLKNYRLPNSIHRLKEELLYEENNLVILKEMNASSSIKLEREQTEYTIKRIKDRITNLKQKNGNTN